MFYIDFYGIAEMKNTNIHLNQKRPLFLSRLSDSFSKSGSKTNSRSFGLLAHIWCLKLELKICILSLERSHCRAMRNENFLLLNLSNSIKPKIQIPETSL